jgi:hypothetical protein
LPFPCHQLGASSTHRDGRTSRRFTTGSAMLGADAKQAMGAGKNFTVTIAEANGLKT